MSDTALHESWASSDDIHMRSGFSATFAPQEVSTPTLLLMAGFAGAGKTTLARWLHEQLGWVVLNKDDLKYARLEAGAEKKANPLEWEAFVKQTGEDAFNELLERLPDPLLNKQSVIVDTSNEKPHIFAEIKGIQKRLRGQHISSQLLIVLCKATKETRTERLYLRGSVFKPYVNELPPILDDSELPERFWHFIGDDNVIHLDTNASMDKYVHNVLQRIKEFEREGTLVTDEII